MKAVTPHVLRPVVLGLMVAALSCPLALRAQDAPATTPTTPNPPSTSQATDPSKQTSTDDAKAAKKARKKQQHDKKVNTRSSPTTSLSKDGKSDADKAKQNPNDKVNLPD